MRTFNLSFSRIFVASATVAFLSLCGAASASDVRTNATAQEPVLALSTADMARLGTQAFAAGKMQEAIAHWTQAAEKGDMNSQYRLASLFQNGDSGIKRDDVKAFRLLQKIVESCVDDDPGSPQSHMAAKAFRHLGEYYLKGIHGTDIRKDSRQAWQLFYHASSVFGDAEAQYHLARLYLTGEGVEKNSVMAARWLRNSAEKGYKNAQATLGELLFLGETISARRAEGLMWLSLAREKAKGEVDEWIVSAHDDAYTLASDAERAEAIRSLRRWAHMGR